MNCDLKGDGSTATAAICTGSSVLSGLGTVESTSTLAAEQIQYAAITITAGQAKLTSFPTGQRDMEAAGSSSSSGIAAPTGQMQWMAGGLAGVAAVIAAL